MKEFRIIYPFGVGKYPYTNRNGGYVHIRNWLTDQDIHYYHHDPHDRTRADYIQIFDDIDCVFFLLRWSQAVTQIDNQLELC